MELTKSNIKLSVIIPFYNVEKDITRCIKSLLNNINDEVELLFIDDCGTDDSRQIVQNFAMNYENIQLITNQTNLKLGPSRIEGLKQARGQWITFVDSDDYVSPDYYAILFKEMNSMKKLVLFNYNRVSSEEENIYTYKGHCFKNDEFYLYKCDPAAWNKMYAKEILLNLPSFDTYVEDVGLWPTIIDRVQNKYVISKKTIYNYVANPNSLTANVDDQKRNDYYKNFDYIFANNEINDGLLMFAYQHLFFSQVCDINDAQEKSKWIEKNEIYLAKQFGRNCLKNKVIKKYKKEKKKVAILKRVPFI